MTAMTARIIHRRDLLGNAYFWPASDEPVGSALMWNPDTQRMTLVLRPFEPSDAVLTQFIRIDNPRYDSAATFDQAKALAESFYERQEP